MTKFIYRPAITVNSCFTPLQFLPMSETDRCVYLNNVDLFAAGNATPSLLQKEWTEGRGDGKISLVSDIKSN